MRGFETKRVHFFCLDANYTYIKRISNLAIWCRLF